MNAREVDLEARRALWRTTPTIQVVHKSSAAERQVIHASFPVAVARRFSTFVQTQLDDPSNGTIAGLELHITTGDFRACQATITWLQNYCKYGTTDFTSSMLGYFPMLNIFKIQEAVNLLDISIIQTHLNNTINLFATAASPLPTIQEAIRILDFPAGHQARNTLCSRLIAAVATNQLQRDGPSFGTILQADTVFRAQMDTAMVDFDAEEARRRREAAESQAKIDAIAAKKKSEKTKAQKEAHKQYYMEKRRLDHEEEGGSRIKKTKLADIGKEEKGAGR